MNRKSTAGLAMIVATGLLTAGASAQDKQAQGPAPKIFTDVTDCRAITDNAQRLDCFDRTVGALASAQQSKDLYVADKETMRETRRGLFGFNLPKVKLFDNDDIGEDVKSIETTIKSVGMGRQGYVFVLEDGARWAQTDGAYMDKPKAGSKIRIRRAALGSFMGSIDGKVGFRIERLNQ
jgi:hypothetical protein